MPDTAMRKQVEMIREHLDMGLPITPKEAIDVYGCMRLSARIYDLRKKGYEIERRTKRVQTRHGFAHVAEYRKAV